MAILTPDPGPLPTLPAPSAGEVVLFEVDGHPPYKDTHFSIRNERHRHHARFLALRYAAVGAMRGRKWYLGPIGLRLEIYGSQMERPIVESVGGVLDTLDGSHGPSFTHLPVVYEDDCQVSLAETRFILSECTGYHITLTFL